METWDQCGLSERLLAALTKHRLEAPFAIQKQVRPSPIATPTYVFHRLVAGTMLLTP